MRRRLPSPVVAAVCVAVSVAVAVAGCGAGGSGGDPLASFGGATLTIQAQDLTFDPDIATMPAGQPLRLVLDNKDAGVPHDLHVFRGDTDIAQSPTVTGPGLTAVTFGPLAPGRYQFECTIHPDMIGTIIVEPGASAGPSSPEDSGPTDTPTPSG